MAKYRSKPSYVEAEQWNGSLAIEALATFPITLNHATEPPGIILRSIHGDVKLKVGDWMVRLETGGGYVIALSDKTFNEKYEPVEG